MTHILETSKVLEIVRGMDTDSNLYQFISNMRSEEYLNISALSHGEVNSAIQSLTSASSRRTADERYRQFLANISMDRVLMFNMGIAECWAELSNSLSPAEYPSLNTETLIVAATAKYYGYQLICDKEPWHENIESISFKYL